MVEPTTNLDGANQPGAAPTLRLNSLRSSHQQSSFSSLFSNLKDFLTERPVKVRAGDSKTFAMPGFGASMGDNLKEFFQAGPKGPVNSGLLVSWDDGVGGFWQN